MDKQGVVFICDRIWLSQKKKKKNEILHLQHDGPRNYHAKWVSQKEKTNIIWYHLHVDSKK